MDVIHELRAACHNAKFVHVWHGNSPAASDGEDDSDERVAEQRHSMHALNHKSSVKLSKKCLAAAGKSYLKHTMAPSSHRVAVRPHGTYSVRAFRGVLWAGSACVDVHSMHFKLLRVCEAEDVCFTYVDSSGKTRRETCERANWSAKATDGVVHGKLLRFSATKITRCARHYTSLSRAYADLALPAHKLIYATPASGMPHPVALINRRQHVVCPTCHTVFHNTVDMSVHMGMKGKWARMTWKTFL